MANVLDMTLEAMEQVEAKYKPMIAAALTSAMDIYVSQTQANNVFRPLPAASRKAIVDSLSHIWVEGARESAAIFESEYKGCSAPECKADESVMRAAVRYTEAYGGRRAAQVISTTEKQMESLIRGGLSQGEAATIVYADVSDKILNIAENRAEIITKTESHSVNQFVSQLLASQSAVPLTKKWNTMNDDRVRRFGLGSRQDAFNHLIMNGTEAPITGTFNVPKKAGGFESLLFPGDPAGSAGNVINCRCIQTYERVG